MTGTDWLLALHVLSAVLLGAGVTGFWFLLLGTRPTAPTLGPAGAGALSKPLTIAVGAGSLGTLVFGVWLAIADDDYQVWDGWIVAAIVLWAAATGLGQRSGVVLAGGGPNARRTGILLQAASTVVLLALLALMLWRPGS